MAPCNCGGAKNKPSPNPNILSNKGEMIMNQQDTEYVEVLYNHRNRGGHPVYGGATGTFYGYRSGGAKFLVHKDDAAAQPTLFQIIPAQPTAPKITYQTPKASPPPPTPMVKPMNESMPGPTPPEPINEYVPQEYKDTLENQIIAEEAEAREKVLSGDLDNIKRPLDLQTLPGITPGIAKRMAAAGLDSKEAILKAGKKNLTKIKGIADARASAIIEYLSD